MAVSDPTFPSEPIIFTGLTNREFLERFAAPGRIGLSGGDTLIDLMIARAERRLDPERRWSLWSHAFLFEGPRVDGRQWLVESDLDLHHKHIRLGVQENRIEKYDDERNYTTLAVMDFALSEAQVRQLLNSALELVAHRTRYSLRELLGVALALRHRRLRPGENQFAREQCLFCSALMGHLFRSAGLDLAPGLDTKHLTPEDIFRTELPHTTWLLQRPGKAARIRETFPKIERHLLNTREKIRQRLKKTVSRGKTS